MDGFAAAQVAVLPLGQVGRVLPMAAGRWLVQRSKAGELLVVDAQLEPVWRLPLPAPDHGVDTTTEELSGWEHEHRLPYRQHGTHAVTDDLSLVALALRRHVLALDGHGQEVARFPHQPWQPGESGCGFSRRSRDLWRSCHPARSGSFGPVPSCGCRPPNRSASENRCDEAVGDGTASNHFSYRPLALG
jgi:hypothetical protein